MDSQNNKISYSEITHRDFLLVAVFFSLVCLGNIVFSIFDLANGQYFSPIMHIILSVLLLFFIGFFFNKIRTAARNKVKSLNEIGEREHFQMNSAVSTNIPSKGKEDEFQLVTNIVLGFFLLLVLGVCLFAFTILCKSISASPTQILSLALIFGGLAIVPYFGVAYQYGDNRKLTAGEQVIVVVALISLCTGVVLWCFY